MKKIAIYSETKKGILDDTAYELISKANDLRKFAKNLTDENIEITNIVISNLIDEASIKKSYKAGADKFVLIKNEQFRDFNHIVFTNAFLSYFKNNPYDYILFPATPTGRMIAPRVTTALNTGLVADCTGIDFIIKDNKLKLASTRPTFGSELMATILSKSCPECATVRPKTFLAKFTNENEGKYEEYFCPFVNGFNLNIIDSINEDETKHNFDNSKVIFCAGFGLYDGKDNIYIEKLKELAAKLKADFAVSRKLVDYEISPNSFQIGQTGSTVTPDVYIAFGISGAIQHIQGMKNSKTIIAINKDSNAEIFKYADYKIVADARNIIDELSETIK